MLIFVSYRDAEAQNEGYIVGNSGTVYKTTNSGANWINIAGGGGFPQFSVACQNKIKM